MTRPTLLNPVMSISMSAATNMFTVVRKRGILMIECGMKSVRMFERDELLNILLPGGMIREGERATFKIKKVKKNA